MHLFSIANVLTILGHSCAVCVPGRPETVLDHGKPMFQVLDYAEAVLHGVSFPNRRAADLVHAWTPRELVRKTTMSLARRYNIPYFVHLEDNEMIILLDELPGWSLEDLERLPTCALDLVVARHRTHPHHSRRLLAGAAGITVLIDRLLEFKPAHVPGIVFFPGYDAAFAKIDGRDEELRAALGIVPDELLVVYTGNIHFSNFREIRSLVLAIALVNRRGIRVKLVKTGWNQNALPELSDPEVAQHVVERGFVARSEIPRLLAAADLLVQPGQSNEFNDYRFPAKLPEFLISGKPVILPRTNVGLLLKNGEEALVLEHGDSADIANALERLAADPELRARIGRRGREFALRNLDWAKNVAVIPNFYEQCLAGPRPAAQPNVADERATPKLIAFYLPQLDSISANDVSLDKGSTERTNIGSALQNFEGHIQPPLPADLGFYDLRSTETMDAQVALARRFGVFGFCFYYYWFKGRRLLEQPLDQFLERKQLSFPFCICWANDYRAGFGEGQDHEISVKQEYEEDLSVKFIRDVIPILKDPRYMTVESKPVLLVYQVSLLPDPRATVEVWRTECRKDGIPSVHLVALQSVGIGDPRPFGFDAVVEFPPHTPRFLINPRIFPGVDPTFDRYAEEYRKVMNDELPDPLPGCALCVMPSWGNSPRREKRAHVLVHSSPAGYQAWLRRVTAQTMAFAEEREPLIFVNTWNDLATDGILEPDSDDGYAFFEATRAGLSQGLADHLRARGIRVEESAVSTLLMPNEEDIVRPDPVQNQDSAPHKTNAWFTDGQLASLASTYRSQFRTLPLTFATIRDLGDSLNYLHPIATATADLIDSQRPWVLKTILAVVPPCSRILDIGGGEPFLADTLARLGYEVWFVDPFDGTGNGPLDYERFRTECPGVRFIRGLFGEQVLPAPPGGFDCIYSTRLLEHLPGKSLQDVFAGMKKYLRPGGWSIHAFDHVHKGSGAGERYTKLKSIVRWAGFEEIELTRLIERLDSDPETHYFLADSHNCRYESVSHDQIRTRVCVSIQMVSRAVHLRVPTGELRYPDES